MKLLPLETQLTIRNCWRCRMTIVDLSVIRFKDIDEIAEQLKVGDGR